MKITGLRNKTVEGHDTEDKEWWCIHGARLEEEFVKICRDRLAIDMSINPEKDTNPYVHDLVFIDKSGKRRIADLKCQNTPFFTASRYGIDPRFAVTFNRKDYERYKKLYPDIVIFYWIDWKQLSWKDKHIDYIGGFYALPFANIVRMIENHEAPEHAYIFRVNDTEGNAKSSFILDLRKFQCLLAIEK